MVVMLPASLSWQQLKPEIGMPLYIAISRSMRAVFSMVLLLLTIACQTYSPYPSTQADGTYVKLPNASIKAVVWG